MIIIPGFLISILTFPGVIVHECGHMLFCRLRGVRVREVCFFRVGNPAGYVVHDHPRDFTSQLLIAVGPFILNSALCLMICLPASVPVKVYDHYDVFVVFQLWLGLSIGMHAFPSTGDARNLWGAAKEAAKDKSVLALLSFPLVVFIYIANLLSFFWFDALYGFGLGIGLPYLVINWLTV